jgi:hypothetical protein
MCAPRLRRCKQARFVSVTGVWGVTPRQGTVLMLGLRPVGALDTRLVLTRTQLMCIGCGVRSTDEVTYRRCRLNTWPGQTHSTKRCDQAFPWSVECKRVACRALRAAEDEPGPTFSKDESIQVSMTLAVLLALASCICIGAHQHSTDHELDAPVEPAPPP